MAKSIEDYGYGFQFTLPHGERPESRRGREGR